MQRAPTFPTRRLLLVTFLAAASVAALVVAHPPLTGRAWSRGDDLALLSAWAVAVAASAWLFVVTGACVLALGFSRPQLARRLTPALPFGIRRLVEIAIVSSCIALPALPARAAGPVHPSSVVADDQPVVRAPEAPAPAPATPAPAAAVQHVVVRAGDNLWSIARAALTHASGRQPDRAELTRYWRVVIAANRSTLRSGDPSLIFPGEMVTLPVVPVVS